jgi:hypothetical protein
MSTGNVDVTGWKKSDIASTQVGKGARNKAGEHAVVELKNGVFWDVTPCGSCKNGRFGRT